MNNKINQQIISEMNILPTIAKNKLHFSNLLSGYVYDNNSFLQNCQYEPMKIQNKKKHHKKISNVNKDIYQSKNIQKTSRTQNLIPIKNDKDPLFPLVTIIVLDAVNNYNDIKQKVIGLNFQKYFLAFFKKTLSGSITPQFLKQIQETIKIINQKGITNKQIQIKLYPSDLFTIKSKQKLIDKIKSFKQKHMNQYIQVLVKFYCLPNIQYRKACLRDIELALTIEIYQKFNCPKDKQYVFLTQNGQVISDLSQILFSTKKMFLSCQTQSLKNYQKYMQILEQFNNKHRKLTFSQNIKLTFRKKIAKGNIQEYDNPNGSVSVMNTYIHNNLEKAEQLIEKRNKSKQQTSSRFFIHKSRKSASQLRPRSISNSSKKKLINLQSIPKGDLWKTQFEKKVEKQFQQLRILNNSYDITFNHDRSNDSYLLMKTLKSHFVVFKDKTKQNIERILKACKLDINTQRIHISHFNYLRGIISGKGNKQNIMEFIGNYLPFNQYGELNRKNLSMIMKEILQCNQQNKQVIVQVIWSWLERNRLLDQNVLRKTKLQSWFQLNKLVYMLLISLIFGTNDVTPLEMAFQILV